MITGLVLDCYNVSFLNFPIPHSWQVSSLIQFLLNNPDLPLVDHLSLYLSACPIRHPFQPLLCVREANVALFRGLLHINAARKLAAESLMRWQQFSPQIFQDSPLYFVFFAIFICVCRTSRNILSDGRLLVQTSTLFIRGNTCPRCAFLCHYDLDRLCRLLTWTPLIMFPSSRMVSSPRLGLWPQYKR